MDNPEFEPAQNSSLEEHNTVPTGYSYSADDKALQPQPKNRGRLLRELLVAALLLALIAGGAFIAATSQKKTTTTQKKTSQTLVVNTQNLDNGTLNKLTGQLDQNGQTQQQLTIAPNTLFKENVDVQGAASVQQNLTVGGNVSIKGTSNLQGAVTIGSNLTINGGLSVGHNASVSGSLSVSGQITAGSINVSSINIATIDVTGDLKWGGHLMPKGVTPTIKTDQAVGGGTATITGTDTAGTITIAVGSGSLVPGEMVIVNFHTAFPLTPKVQLTPASELAANLPYFVGQSPGFFTIRTTAAPSKGVYIFNYFVTE